MKDRSLLEAALVGYKYQAEEIARKITDIKRQLDGGSTPITAATKRRKMSAAARKRISAAQKKRWAEFHKQKAAAQAAEEKAS